MSDIVERLAAAVDEFYGRHPCGLLGEARHEIGRLRAALQSLTTDPPPTLDEPDTDAEVVIKMREIARRALEPEP
jgi:hypothetical protein